jgi:hypothetical protein
VCWNITRVNICLLFNVHLVQELEYRIDVCLPCHPRCTRRTFLFVKNFFSFPVAVNNSIKVGRMVFLL